MTKGIDKFSRCAWLNAGVMAGLLGIPVLIGSAIFGGGAAALLAVIIPWALVYGYGRAGNRLHGEIQHIYENHALAVTQEISASFDHAIREGRRDIDWDAAKARAREKTAKWCREGSFKFEAVDLDWQLAQL